LVSGGHDFIAAAAGFNHPCGVTRGEGAFCWGWNRLGQLGTGNRSGSQVPVRVADLDIVPPVP
ncbi:MAG: RCC1 repeat- and reductase domain-containing protein, partial [Gemmatimonadales bacterium]